jgi:hypothetical protein
LSRSGFLPPLAVLFAALSLPTLASAQDLAPAAYTPVPVGVNIVTLLASTSRGDITFDPSLPVDDGHARLGAVALALTRSLNIAGRSASIGVAMPYVTGHLTGEVLGQFQEVWRSGLSDLSMRVAVNLHGAPAMTMRQFATYRAKTVVGTSFSAQAPVGQYYPAKIINIGGNRWVMKPDLGISHKRGRWTIEGDFGAVFFSDNTNFQNGATRAQSPVVAVQGHLIYTIRTGLWIASDGNFWQGGRATKDGVEAARAQKNSRLGATLAVPIRRHQVRIAYSFGAYTTIGGDFHSVGVSYSYAWFGRP